LKKKKIELHSIYEGNAQIYIRIQLMKRKFNETLMQEYKNNKETSVPNIVLIQYEF